MPYDPRAFHKLKVKAKTDQKLAAFLLYHKRLESFFDTSMVLVKLNRQGRGPKTEIFKTTAETLAEHAREIGEICALNPPPGGGKCGRSCTCKGDTDERD